MKDTVCDADSRTGLNLGEVAAGGLHPLEGVHRCVHSDYQHAKNRRAWLSVELFDNSQEGFAKRG